MSSIRPIVKPKNTILYKFTFGLGFLFFIMTLATYMVVDLVAKSSLVKKNKELIEETGSHIVSEISLRIGIAETLTRNLAVAGETLPKQSDLFKNTIPQMLDIKENKAFIIGGGIWPEPDFFTHGVARNSFFWGRDVQGELKYFDQYNNLENESYHNEEWYVYGRYSKPGECIWSKSYIDPYTHLPMVTCTVAMFEQEMFAGTATVDVSLGQLKNILIEASEKLGGYAYAVDRNNKFLSFPDDKITKTQSLPANTITDYITINELAQKHSSFKPVAKILSDINQSLVHTMTSEHSQLAKVISGKSYKILASEADLIVANMNILRNKSLENQAKTTSIVNQHDYFFDEPVDVSVFMIPKTLWKVVVVTPQKMAVSNASAVSNLILILLIAIMSVAAFFGFFYCRRSLIVPMYQMVNQLQQPEKDNGKERTNLLDDRRQDEFGLLAYHFNQSNMTLDRKNRDLQLQIKERKQAEHKLKHLALHDPLTGLPNRLLFQERLQQTITVAKKNQQKFAVFFMDLDNFKIINDTMGHEAGDELLKQVASRLSAVERDNDMVARLGGDEFAFIIANVVSIDDTYAFAQRLNKQLRAPLVVKGKDLNMGGSIGITIFPDDADNSEELLSNADIAMYQAKEDGRNTTRLFTYEMTAKLQQNKDTLTDLAHSLKHDHFELYYQPLLTIDNQTLVGAEALIRWHHPTKGLIPPDQFISIAEKGGLINELGDWVLARACREINELKMAGIDSIRVAINISPVQFKRENFLQQMLRILYQHDVSAESIELEITEGAVIDDVDEAVNTMKALFDAGFNLSIDDFGTGYSSLSYLKRFPVQKVKIDRSFISDLENDEDSQSITTAIIQMSHSLGLHVLAEGVETPAQLHYLQAEKCNYVQGDYAGKPMPIDLFIDTFAKSTKNKTAKEINEVTNIICF